MKKLTIEKFIEKAQKIHGNKYDYSKSIYVNSNSKLIIICPLHGEFLMNPHHHLNGQGCPMCGNINRHKSKRLTVQKIEKNFYDIYKNKYKITSINRSEKDNILISYICPTHGNITQNWYVLKKGFGCPKCQVNVYNIESFILKANEVHNFKYNYDKFIYVNSKTKGIVTCPIHGDFTITPDSHLQNCGCYKCGKIKAAKAKSINNIEWIKRAIKKYGYKKYGFWKVNYIDCITKIDIYCYKCGQYFKAIPRNFMNGECCPKCHQSHLERDIEQFLNEKKINFEYQKKFNWLNKQSLDFYLPDYNTAIECQGKQHFKNNCFFESLEIIQNRDNLKKKLCDSNGVKLLYYSNLGIEYPYDVFEDKDELLTYIKQICH